MEQQARVMMNGAFLVKRMMRHTPFFLVIVVNMEFLSRTLLWIATFISNPKGRCRLQVDDVVRAQRNIKAA
jgi:hypothetical protein